MLQLGPAGWLTEQLAPGRDAWIDHRLSGFKTLPLSVAEAFAAYPRPEKRLKEAGIDPASPDAKAKLLQLTPAEELPRQIVVEATQARLLREVKSSRQLEEVLVDFWFNHFNVSAEKGEVRWMVSAYERDAIRPFVLGRFRDLLGATAKHPAMLWYLDNWLSVRDGLMLPGKSPRAGLERLDERRRGKLGGARQELGLNENYARELLELHTLGVEAGYSQDDVREAARALTGWSIELREKGPGFGRFVFRPLAHDEGEKHVFGLALGAGGGERDGEQLLDFLARHPATAHHVALKLCQRFVADEPPPALVDRVAAEFLRTDGDLPATYRAIFESPEVWSDAAFGAKTKTPLELVVSAVRVAGELDEVQQPMAQALDALGQPLYRCQPPTGYAEIARPWVSAGALVTRINFGLRLARGQLPGVRVALPPASPRAEDTIASVSNGVLGGPAGVGTLETVRRALSAGEAMEDGEQRRVDPALVAGLLLGSPEFQKQ